MSLFFFISWKLRSYISFNPNADDGDADGFGVVIIVMFVLVLVAGTWPQTGNAHKPAMPTNQHKPIPIDFGPVFVCFDHYPKLLNCEIAQPSHPEDPGNPLQNHSRQFPEGDGSLDFSSGKRIQTYPDGGGPLGGLSDVMTVSSESVLCTRLS